MTSVAARCALVLVAALVGGWLALSYSAERLESQTRTAFVQLGRGESLTAEQLAHAENSLRRARRFNVDPSPLVSESLLLVFTGHRARARAAARRVVTEEPDNLDGWRLMHALAPNRATAAHARRMMKTLNPYATSRPSPSQIRRARGNWSGKD